MSFNNDDFDCTSKNIAINIEEYPYIPQSGDAMAVARPNRNNILWLWDSPLHNSACIIDKIK